MSFLCQTKITWFLKNLGFWQVNYKIKKTIFVDAVEDVYCFSGNVHKNKILFKFHKRDCWTQNSVHSGEIIWMGNDMHLSRYFTLNVSQARHGKTLRLSLGVWVLIGESFAHAQCLGLEDLPQKVIQKQGCIYKQNSNETQAGWGTKSF